LPFISFFFVFISPYMASSAISSELVLSRHRAANATTINFFMRHLLIGTRV